MDYSSLNSFYKSINRAEEAQKSSNIEQINNELFDDEKSPMEFDQAQDQPKRKASMKLECVLIEKMQPHIRGKNIRSKRANKSQNSKTGMRKLSKGNIPNLFVFIFNIIVNNGS
jgi:hypothetical protein